MKTFLLLFLYLNYFRLFNQLVLILVFLWQFHKFPCKVPALVFKCCLFKTVSVNTLTRNFEMKLKFSTLGSFE